jgi:hypothetical protein
MVTAWIFFGLIFYVLYGVRFSVIRRQMSGELKTSSKEHSEQKTYIHHEISMPLLSDVPTSQYNTMLS